MPCVAEFDAAAVALLDLHEGIATPLVETACGRWPEHLRLLNGRTGELVHGRCRATNKCDYCARLFAVETSEMLLLDAMEYAPTLYVVLTARELLTKPAVRRHLMHLRRTLKRRWPSVEWAVLVEFQKRGALHLNLLTKGVSAADVDSFLAAASDAWCARVDAEPVGQWAGVIADEEGVVKYVTLHFMKPAQAPPIGWRGHRYSSTRGYLVRPAAVMREEARRSLRLKRKLWRGLSLEVAEHELQADEQVAWSLWTDPAIEVGPNLDRARAADARRPLLRLKGRADPPVAVDRAASRDSRSVVGSGSHPQDQNHLPANGRGADVDVEKVGPGPPAPAGVGPPLVAETSVA